MQEQINALRAALEAAKDIDTATRGELAALNRTIGEKCGQPYEYGLPGSDPNVEQQPDGGIVVTLIYPISSGSESIEQLRLRPLTIGDRKNLPADEFQATCARLQRSATVAGSGRPLSPSEVEKIHDEDYLGLVGALNFLQTRFRQTGQSYKTR